MKYIRENNLIVQTCIEWNRMETLTEIQRKMNTDQYCDILAHGLEKSLV